jgi:Tol biopolymer transport system component
MELSNPITPETIVYDLKSVTSPRISPDASTVIYALAEQERGELKGKSQLWRQELKTGERRQLTFTGRNWLPRWSHHSDRLAFLTDRNEGTGICVLPFKGGEAEEIVNHKGGISDLSCSPDGASIAYAAIYDPENPDDVEPDKDKAPKVRVSRRRDYKQDMRGFLNDKRSQIWIVDVASKERRRVTTDAVDYTDPSWSPDGKKLVFKIVSRAGIFN